VTVRTAIPLLGLLLVPGGLWGQEGGDAPRWMVQVVGPAVIVHGDLRLEVGGGRFLLESADTAWWPLEALDTAGSRLGFVAGGWRFAGDRTGTVAEGMATDPEGRVQQWRAQRLPAGAVRWPVRPRVAVRQLLFGSPATEAGFADRWRAARPSADRLQAEYAAATAALGWRVPPPGGVASHATALALGFDPAGREAARALLARIGASPAGTAEFRRLFIGGDGALRLDLHDVAWDNARRLLPALGTAPGLVVPALRALGLLPEGGGDAPEQLVQAGWQAWGQAQRDPEAMTRRLGGMADARSAAALRALLAGYTEGLGWWTAALRWLVTAPWLEVPGGRQSPAALLADFWGGDVGPLPMLRPTAFGSPQAVPVLGATHLAPWLLEGRNAIAAEWLAGRTAAVEALTAWRAFDTNEALDVVLTDGHRAVVTAPAAVTRTRYGAFLEADDAIRIEPGMLPLFAVATVVHEWLHILVERARLEGEAPRGLQHAAWGVRLLEADPWLGEGIAEWGTDAVLAPARDMTTIYAVLEAGKRIGLAEQLPDDPHVLGYALVRALADRLADPGAVRDLLVRHLHDPAAVARAVDLDGPATTTVSRPATLAILPEYVFTVDDGVADAPVRRLHLSVRPEDDR
jgi:hypothetical protein